mmetsp:Transcript_44065/g.80510  ORF Transcript_44065/g.80510 Transcript_44065/m.80510 type:complete len:136 (+) Transcript_44065:37-444(+)
MAKGLVFAGVLLINVVLSAGASSFLAHHAQKDSAKWLASPSVVLAVEEGHALAARVEQAVSQPIVSHVGGMHNDHWSFLTVAAILGLVISTVIVFMWSQDLAWPVYGPWSYCCMLCTPFACCFPVDTTYKGIQYG